MMTGGFATARRSLIGVVLVALLAIVARFVAPLAKPVPDVALALLLGIGLRNTLGLLVGRDDGVSFMLKYGLRTAIILLGSGLSVGMLIRTGAATLTLVVACVVIAMALGLLLSRAFRLPGTVGTLIGAGTAICGGTAILTIAPLTRARNEEVAYALTTIFTFNLLALLLYPWLGHLMRLTNASFGSWAGTAVNDTSIVVATGYVYSSAAGAVATIVKLTRTVLLVPLAIAVGMTYAARQRSQSRSTLWSRAKGSIPWFVLGFVGMAAANSVGILPPYVVAALNSTASFLIVMVLAAVGLTVDVVELKKLGSRPLVVGLLLASVMAVVSLTLIHALRIA